MDHTATAAVTITGFDHLVLRCADVERTLAWYTDALGLAPVRVDEWRLGVVPFPSVRVDAGTILDLIRGHGHDGAAAHDRHDSHGHGSLDHFCLVVTPTDLAELARSGAFDVVDGPDTRYGARGDGTSLYVRDPDGVVVELRHY